MSEVLCIRDSVSGSSARIAPHLGFNCFEFTANAGGQTVAVLEASPQFPAGTERPSGHGIPLLFPFPNRISGGRFVWDGKEYHLPENLTGYDGAGNAIHGFCLDRPWRVIQQTDHSVVGEFRLADDAPERAALWPADFRLRVRYAVRDAVLEMRIIIENPSEEPLPWGFGTHPYFRLPLGTDSDPQHCLIEIPATEEWELIDCLPTGIRRPVSGETDFRHGAYYGIAPLDDVLTGLQRDPDNPFFETVIYDEAAGLQITQRFDETFREVVVYTPPDRDAVAIEPYTCVTDAVNLQQRGIDAGWRVLPPGERVQLGIDIEAGPVIV